MHRGIWRKDQTSLPLWAACSASRFVDLDVSPLLSPYSWLYSESWPGGSVRAALETSFAQHMHKFDPSQETLRRGKRFAPSIGRFTQLMALFHNVVKTFDLADHGRHAVLLVIASYSRGSGLPAVKRVSMLKTLGHGRDDFMHIPNKNIETLW